jgi:crotonobetaine/carnitine-CoA ligase
VTADEAAAPSRGGVASPAEKDADRWHTVFPHELARRAALHPDRPFLAWQAEPYATYAEVHERIRRLAGGLSDLGVNRGDTVAIMLPNCLELIDTWFAVNYLGAVEVPVNVHDRGMFLRHVLADSGARLVVVDSSVLGEVAALRDQVNGLDTVVVLNADGNSGEDWCVDYAALAGTSRAVDPVPLDYRDLMAVLYTSGTSGPAKGVMMSYAHACVSALPFMDAVEMTESDIFFVCMPLFHSNAQAMQVIPTLLAGARATIWPGFDASRWWNQVSAVGATVTNTLGVMCQALFQQPPRHDDAENTLRVVQTIPAPASIAAEFETRFGVRCVDGYGLTDAAILSFRQPDEALVPGSSGRPLDTFELIVADPDTDIPQPPGTVGEILVRPRRPYGFMSGYWRNAEATAQAWRNLWFHTGDAGYLDAEGLLYFHDRLKDVIRVRGENVSSAMVEAAVLMHPAVAECAAVAVPAGGGDDDVKICVVLAEGATVSPEALIEHCRGLMPYFALPSYVEFHPQLPRTATDKVRKVLLRRGIPDVETWDRRKARQGVSSGRTP